MSSVKLTPTCEVVFLSKEKGQLEIKKNDVFIKTLSKFDLAVRLKEPIDSKATLQRLFEHYIENIEDFTQDEIELLTKRVKSIADKLKDHGLDNIVFPKIVKFVKITRECEGAAAFCRNPDCVMLPKHMFSERVVNHELFHIYSRNNLVIQDELYASLKFIKAEGEVVIPDNLKNRIITNPDCPHVRHYISEVIDGKEMCCFPVLYSKSEKYTTGNLFDYMMFSFVVLKNDKDSGKWIPVKGDDGKCVIQAPNTLPGFHSTKYNTTYIIHPEEILADNFVFLCNNGEEKFKFYANPTLLEKMKKILCKGKKNEKEVEK